MPSGVRITDGSFDWAGGVDSGRIPTIQSELTPHGLARNQLAWMDNCTVRGGGILQRMGWKHLCTLPTTAELYQGGWLYDASHQSGFPYLMLLIGGNVYQVRVDTDNSIVNVTALFPGTANPPLEPMAFFVQGEEFMVIQAGDLITLPLFWDGTALWRSIGLAGSAVGELPAAGPMDYYMGRIWYAQGRQYTAGDIVGGPAGTIPYGFRDSVLKVTENPLAIGGDGFIVPTQAGNIRALRHSCTIDTALGQGQLFAFTRKVIYSLDVPVSRNDWISADSNQQPLQKVVQITQGSYGDRCIPAVNGDLFYQAPDGIRSLLLAIRYFQQWGNTPISRNLNRLFQFNDRALMQFASGIQFDNRLLMTGLPYDTTDVGVAFQTLAVLDFDLISSLGERLPPAWEGIYEGLDFLQLFEGDYGGRQRAFGVIRSRVDGTLQVWELTNDERFDQGDDRVYWSFETPAYTWGKETELKKLDGGEFWIDKLYGTAEIEVYYRTDSDPCWQLWTMTQMCSAKSTCEDVVNPVCYPEQAYREGFRWSVTLPKPTRPACTDQGTRPNTVGYQFQLKFIIHGWLRIRGLLLHAIPVEQAPFANLGKTCL